MKGRIRFMTAITSAYAHAYQVICLTRHMPAVPRLNFRLPKPQARYPHLLNVRTTTRERGNDFQGWAIYTDGGTRHVNGETLARWGVIARLHHGRIVVMFWSGHHRRWLILLFQMPELIPTTPLKSLLWLRHCLFSGPVAQTCCWCVWAGSSPHTCAAGASMSTIYDQCPTQATAHHATRTWSQWKSR